LMQIDGEIAGQGGGKRVDVNKTASLFTSDREM